MSFADEATATYFAPGLLLMACIGAEVEFACASVVLDGTGVCPAAVFAAPEHDANMAAATSATPERATMIPCMPAIFP
jgi:hypothetical protein